MHLRITETAAILLQESSATFPDDFFDHHSGRNYVRQAVSYYLAGCMDFLKPETIFSESTMVCVYLRNGRERSFYGF